MSYGAAAALQQAVYQHLIADPVLEQLVSGAVYDTLPQGPLPSVYVTLGPEDARVRSDRSGKGAWHRFTVSVIAETESFLVAKTVAAAVSDALVDAALDLNRGRLVALQFLRARAGREGAGALRRIDVTFRARVDDTD